MVFCIFGGRVLFCLSLCWYSLFLSPSVSLYTSPSFSFLTSPHISVHVQDKFSPCKWNWLELTLYPRLTLNLWSFCLNLSGSRRQTCIIMPGRFEFEWSLMYQLFRSQILCLRFHLTSHHHSQSVRTMLATEAAQPWYHSSSAHV